MIIQRPCDGAVLCVTLKDGRVDQVCPDKSVMCRQMWRS